MKTCMKCGIAVFDADEFINECRKNNLTVNENTLEVILSPGGMFIGDFSDYAQRLQEKEKIREKGIRIQNRMGMFCNDCKEVYCLKCISISGKIHGDIRGCISCGGKMIEIREHNETLKYGKTSANCISCGVKILENTVKKYNGKCARCGKMDDTKENPTFKNKSNSDTSLMQERSSIHPYCHSVKTKQPSVMSS